MGVGQAMSLINRGVVVWSVDEYVNYYVFACVHSHLERVGHIKSFAIVSEEALVKGIRRIIALTGREAEMVSEEGC